MTSPERPTTEEVDVVVMGLGIAGEELVGDLLDGGATVVGVERELVGGECNNWGCVPTKMMVRAGNVLAEARRVDVIAGRSQVQPDWAPVARRVREEATAGWTDDATVKDFVEGGMRFVRGHARLTGPGAVRVSTADGVRDFVATRAVVLATGTEPTVPPIDGLAGTPFWTNRDIAQLTTVPASIIVLGAGAVGLELAQILARFGAEVTVIEAADRVLSNEDPEASAIAQAALEADGITIRTQLSATRVSYDDGFRVELSDGATARAERLLVAVGRTPNLGDIGLETIGLDPAASTVEVDDRLRAGDGLWAIGDITGKGEFTHVGTYQARIAALDILGRPTPGADYRAVPRVVYTDPEIGAVGLTEEQASHRGIRVRIGTQQVAKSARGWMHQAGNEGLLKLIADADRDILVGALSAGPVGGEVLAMLTVAVRAQVPLSMLRDMIYAYPTFHRGVEDALREMSE
jgi:pyruvate/2-oxoglutarate dehydrogenase complex dihydrolipoamide dehydrogenase (E3) component